MPGETACLDGVEGEAPSLPVGIILWRRGQLPVLHVERQVNLHGEAPTSQRQARPGSFPGTRQACSTPAGVGEL